MIRVKYYVVIVERLAAYFNIEPGMTHVKISVQSKHAACDSAKDKRCTALCNAKTDLLCVSRMETKLSC